MAAGTCPLRHGTGTIERRSLGTPRSPDSIDCCSPPMMAAQRRSIHVCRSSTSIIEIVEFGMNKERILWLTRSASRHNTHNCCKAKADGYPPPRSTPETHARTHSQTHHGAINSRYKSDFVRPFSSIFHSPQSCRNSVSKHATIVETKQWQQ